MTHLERQIEDNNTILRLQSQNTELLEALKGLVNNLSNEPQVDENDTLNNWVLRALEAIKNAEE